MRIRLLLGMFALTLCGMVMVSEAGEKNGAPTAAQKAEMAAQQQQLARQFEEFQLLMLKLKQRMERGSAEEQTRAKAIGRILDDVQKGSLKTKFDQLAEQLRTSKLTNTSELKEMKQRAQDLTEELQRILRMFQDDPRTQQLREEARLLKDLIRDIGKLIEKQKLNQGLTEANKTDKNELSQNQGKITKGIEQTNQNIDKFLGKKVDGIAQEAKNLKGGPKVGGKNEKASAVAKGDGEQEPQTAQGETKPGGEEKPTQVASAKPDQNPSDKEGDAQAKQGQGADGQAKDKKQSDGSASSQAKANEGAKGNEAGSKANEGAKNSTASAKPGSQSSKGSPSQAKAGEGQAGSKPGEGSKSGQAKAGSGQPSQGGKASQGSAKSGSTSKGQATAKNDGAQSQKSPQGNQSSQAQAKQDQGDHGAQSAKITQNDGGGSQSPKGNQKTKDELAKNQKKVLEAGYESIKAENEIVQGKKKPALQNQDNVIDNLQHVKENLEKLLRQTREEELERLLAALEARCRKMLEMQMAVLAGTEQTHKAILLRAEKKAGREEQQASLRLSDQEKEIIGEANKAIQMLEEEGSAVAFPEVFQQVREDMKHVQRRLEVVDVADVTQQVEKDIIDSLKEMIEALKKAQQQNKAGQSKDGNPPPNADQKLLDKIAELKMIRSLQKRVNDRTQFYGRLFPSEQAMDPNIRQSLQQLAERQERIFEIMDRFAKGDGK